jgi:hypothetical protein
MIHDTTDQTKPKITKIKQTKEGAFPEIKDTTNPSKVRGSIQYPITLIDWKIDLFIDICTLCFPVICN